MARPRVEIREVAPVISVTTGPAASRPRAWTIQLVPSLRDQAAVTLPAGSTATCGFQASPRGESSTGSDHSSCADRRAASTTRPPSTSRDQVAVALPARSTATCGSQELLVGSESTTGVLQAPPA